MIVGAVADVHGNFAALSAAMARHPDVERWLCVGDLASRSGGYPDVIAPLYWIKGNNENFDQIARWEGGAPQPPHLHFIPNGTATMVGPLRVAGLGGTFAPTWYDTPGAQLPARPGDDKRRHFVREEVDACRTLGRIDVLMTHEAARPFVVTGESGTRAWRRDAGKPAINDLLATLRPRLHLCGHHHRFTEMVREGVRSVCIDRINRSYLLLDAVTLEYELVAQAE